MLGKVFARLVEQSPISVMVRGTLERILSAEQLDAWFARTAQKQYTRTVLFSTVYDVLSQVVFRIKPSVRAAYRDHEAKVEASLISLSNKLTWGRDPYLGSVGTLECCGVGTVDCATGWGACSLVAWIPRENY